jgi:exopolysaccharide production protein ExoQ
MHKNNNHSQRMRGQDRLFTLPLFLVLLALTLSPDRPSVSLIPSLSGPSDMPYYYLAMFAVLYLLAFFMLITRPSASWRIVTNHVAYLAFIAYIILSAQWSAFPIDTLKKSTHYIGLLLVCTAAIIVLSRKERSMLRIFVVYASIAIILCIATVLIFPSRGIDPLSRRWMGLASHPNGLGIIAMIAVWANVNYLFYTKHFIERVWSVIIIGLAGACLYGSNSMTSAVLSVLLIVFVPTMMWFDKRNIRRTIMIIGAIAVPTLIILAMFMISTDQSLRSDEVVDKFFSVTGRDKNLSGRTGLWEIAWWAFEQKPLLGWGFDDLMSLSLKRHLEYKQLHNGYLDLLVRGGIVGSAIMGYLIIRKYYLFSRLARINWRLFITLASLSTAILVHNFTEASLVRGQHPLWLLFIFVLFYLNREALSHPKNELPNNKARTHGR